MYSFICVKSLGYFGDHPSPKKLSASSGACNESTATTSILFTSYWKAVAVIYASQK